MANWTESWKPQFIYRKGMRFNTLVSQFENGDEQRRAKWAAGKGTFGVEFHGLAVATAVEIQTFFDARLGRYGAFNFPSYGQLIQGTRLALVEGGAEKDTITDSSSGFVTGGYDTDHDVWIAQSGAGNNGIYTVYSVAAGTITLNTGQDIADESGNASLLLYKTYSVRFIEDSLQMEYITPSVCSLRFELDEV